MQAARGPGTGAGEVEGTNKVTGAQEEACGSTVVRGGEESGDGGGGVPRRRAR